MQYEFLKCLLCGSISSSEIIEIHRPYTILYCRSCNFRFSYPDKEIPKNWYSTSSIYEHRSKRPRLLNPEKDWRFKMGLKFLEEVKGGRILDIGCGDGGFLYLAEKRGFKGYGIDIDPRAVSLAKNVRGLKEIYEGSWEVLVEQKARFDAITMFDFFEHNEAPLSLMNRLLPILHSGGLIIMTVPNLDRFPPIFDPELDYPPHHWTLWSRKSLEILCKKTGLEEIEIIEKPLNGEDLYIFPLLSIKRKARWIRDKLGISGAKKRGLSQNRDFVVQYPNLSAKRFMVKETVRGGVLIIFHIFSRLMRLYPRTRGMTLFLKAKKI